MDYYEEALRRDPDDVRNNNALGLWYLRRGRFAKAEPYFRKAIATLTRRNPNPYDGEPFYNLGWALKFQDRHAEAFDAFYKCVWNDAWQHAGYLNLARIAVQQKDFTQALDLVRKSLIKNVHSHTARHLQALVLRYLNRVNDAKSLIRESLELDPFNLGCLYEKYLLLKKTEEGSANDVLTHLKTISRSWVHNFLECALDYAHAGLFDDASAFLSVYYDEYPEGYSLVPYYLGWFTYRSGDHNAAKACFTAGSALNPDYVFPDRLEEILILQTAIGINPEDSKAFYYLGNLWYDKRQYDDAIRCWERSAGLKSDFPTVHRNLGLAYYNKCNDPGKALASMETAFTLDRKDARVLMELDQLYKKLNRNHTERMALLEEYLPLVHQRDDLYLEQVTLYNQLSNHQKAKDLLTSRRFHPWEGGEGKVVGQYLICHLELAKQALQEGHPEEALGLLDQAEKYPDNLGEGKLYGAQENDIHYLKAIACEMMNQREAARDYFTRAASGNSEPVQAIFYNDPQPDKVFYRGLAWKKLNRPEKAAAIFRRLIDFGMLHMNDEMTLDYFAVSLPDLLVFDADLNLRNKIHCLYMMGLGYMGLGHEFTEKAEELFSQVLSLDNNHQGALVHRRMLKNPALLYNNE
jgi:tetratricopeptide (TPR) repeat protein